MRRLAAGAVLGVALLAGCGAANSFPTAPGASATNTSLPGPMNVTGVVVAGPRCPVATVEKPCPDAPVGDVEVTFTPPVASMSKVTVRTAGDGTFSLWLAPGRWTALVQADPAKGVMSAKPEEFVMPDGGSITLTLHGDTGIR